MTPEEREKLEGIYTFRRGVELELNPVQGKFDAAHLKEINRRIFQDLPGLGFEDVTPGQFRPPTPEGCDWMKQRGLSTQPGTFYVAYSRMDEAAQARMDKALEGAKPEQLRGLKTAEFTARLGELYAELDYTHPFTDGNSRTLRAFTRQLAKESGYELDWERFSRSEAGRDLLYIARDRSVNALALPNIAHEANLRRVSTTQYQLSQNRDLPSLLADVVRPSRAVAFERDDQGKALQAFPELREAYDTVRAAGAYFAAKLPGQVEQQQAAVLKVREQIQGRLNAGHTRDLQAERDSKQPARLAEEARARPGPSR